MNIAVESFKPSSYEHHNRVATKAVLCYNEGNTENIIPIHAKVVVDPFTLQSVLQGSAI